MRSYSDDVVFNALLRLIVARGQDTAISATEIATEANASSSTTHRAMKRLRQSGKVQAQRESSGQKYRYRIAANDNQPHSP